MPSLVEVPLSSNMDDQTFVAHWNKRHRKTDSTLAGDLVWSPWSTSYGVLRQFHIHCHQAEVDGGTIQLDESGPFTPQYNHKHTED